MMFNSSKIAKAIEQLQSEIADLRSVIKGETARADAAEAALHEIRENIGTLQETQRYSADTLSDLAERVEQTQSKLNRAQDRIDQFDQSAEDRNRLLKLEKRIDQQATDLQSAIAGLIDRIDIADRSRKP